MKKKSLLFGAALMFVSLVGFTGCSAEDIVSDAFDCYTCTHPDSSTYPDAETCLGTQTYYTDLGYSCTKN